MHHMYGSWGTSVDWLWMTVMILLWIVVIGAVVYAATRLALHHDHKPEQPAPPAN